MIDVQASDFLTIGLLVLLEGLLSADNALVLAILVLGLPREEQRQALRYGIIGAFAFRILATMLAVQLIQFGWVKLVGAAYLLYLTFKHFFGGGDAEQRRSIPQARAAFGLSAFWATVVLVFPFHFASVACAGDPPAVASSWPITIRIAMMPKIPPAMITHVFDDIATATRIESTAKTISVSSTLTTVAQNAESPNAARACGMLRRSCASPPPKKCLKVR